MSSNDESEEKKNLVPGLTQQDRHTKVRRLRGLSYVATDDEVLEFLKGYEILRVYLCSRYGKMFQCGAAFYGCVPSLLFARLLLI